MIVSYFNNTKPVNFIFLSTILVFLILFSFYFNESKVFSVIQISNVLILLASFFVFNFMTKSKSVSSKNNFGILFYVLISGLLFTSFFDFNKIIANFLTILALQQLYNLSNKEKSAKEKVFNNGLLLGMATLFYPLSVVFILLTYIANMLFNKMNWRMFIIPIIGFVIPLFLVFSLNNFFGIELVSNYIPNVTFSLPFLTDNIILYIIVGFLGFLLLWSLFTISVNLNSKLVAYKDYHTLTVLQLILAVFLLVFSPNKDGSEMLFLIFPLSILLAHLIKLIPKKRLSNLIIFSLIVLLVLQFFTKSQITSIT